MVVAFTVQNTSHSSLLAVHWMASLLNTHHVLCRTQLCHAGCPRVPSSLQLLVIKKNNGGLWTVGGPLKNTYMLGGGLSIIGVGEGLKK